MSNPLADDLNHVLDHTVGLWDELRGQRLFITGGTGFFGCWLLESFTWACDKLDLDTRAVVLTRSPGAFRGKAPHLADHPAVELYEGDVRDFAFPQGKFTHVIHAATDTSAVLNEVDPLAMIDAIIDGTRRTLDFARQARSRKFLLTSSGVVYGPQPPEMTHIHEDYRGAPDTMDPRSAYGEGKRVAELLCAIYAQQYGLEVKIARHFGCVGPYLRLDSHHAVGNFISDALAGRPIQIKGDGRACRSYIYAADLVIWLWTILFAGQTCRPYNVGSETEVTISQLATTVARSLDSSYGIQLQMRAPSALASPRFVPSACAAREELGLDAFVGLADAIRRTANALQCGKQLEVS